MRKRFFALLLALCLTLGLLPGTAWAAEGEPHIHPICGGTCSHTSEDNHGEEAFTAWDGTTALTAGNYYLSEDVTRSSTLTISGTVNLCLNGHVIKKTGNSRVITVNSSGTLNICDCNTTTVHKFSVDSATGLWTLDEVNGTETVTGGVITGGVASGTSNTPTIEGGGVLVNGTFCLRGGSIIGNTVQKTTAGGNQYGGGVSVDNGGEFTMTGGAITGNVSKKDQAGGFMSGGGVSVINGSFTMSGGTISSNRCTNSAGGSFQRGGGVYSTGTFTMTGGTISGNTADTGGGGVYSTGTFTMTGGTISGNTADTGGGGVYSDGTFTMTGGAITGNLSKSNGGGVRISGPSFTLSGSPTITGNKNGSADNNVYLDEYYAEPGPGEPHPRPDERESLNRFITIGEDFAPNEKIGVITAIKPACGKPTDITGANNKDYSQYFASENKDYTVQNSGTDVVQLVKPHALTKTEAKAATCTEEGKKNYWTCSDCKKLFSDAAGTTETTEADLTIAARNHNYTYAASGGCITGTCQNDSSHTHTATLTAANATYDGAAKETGLVTYSEGWPDKNLTITYSGNSGVGTATASITYSGATAEVNFTITAVSQDAPSANEGYTIDYTSETLTLGSGYEASTSENFADKLNSGAKIQPGTTLYIRKAAVAGTDPSPAAANTVPVRPAQPSGVNAVGPTAAGANDGKITGVSTDMEYSPDGTAWTPCPGTEVTGLAAGSYQVRVKATGSAFAGATVTVTVGAGHTHNEDGGTVTKAPTQTEAGVKTYRCTVCQEVLRTEEVPALGFGISGAVTQGGSAADGVTVTLKQGNTTIATTTTADGGKYSFSGVAPGSYNVVATKDSRIVTILVEIKSGDAEGQNLTMPSGNVNSVLEVRGGDTPAVVVGGLEKEAEANKEEDSTVTVTMTVEAKAEAQAEKAKEIKAAAGDKKLDYLEIKLKKTVDVGGSATTDEISTTNDLLTIIIPFDFSGKNKASVTVYRYHGDSVDTLTTTANAKGEKIELGTDSIILKAKNFSTYAIGYTEIGSGGSSSGSHYSPTYSITLPGSVPNGAVGVSPKNARKGTTVTITVTPDEGYEIGTVTVTDKDGKEISVTGKGDGKYTFTMPAGKVNVSASFTKIRGSYANCPKDNTCPVWPYTDTDITAWYHDGVHYCIVNGLMVGYDSHTFGPDGDISRAMIATILWRLEGSPVMGNGKSGTFPDVPEDQWYTDAIEWAAAAGVVTGYGDGNFGPADPITREQLAAMLYRFEQYKGGGFIGAWMFQLDYTDAQSVSSWAYEPMCWTTMNGIIRGIGNGLLNPKGTATRAEAATMLLRFLVGTEK